MASWIDTMKTVRGVLLTLLLLLGVAQSQAATRNDASGTSIRDTGVRTAETLSTVTGMAISPLLGVGAVGAYQWWNTPEEYRTQLHWFARPWFWIPALLLAAAVAAKDILGTAAPTVLKKPFDIAEAIENKVSGLVVAGAVIPYVTTIFPESNTAPILASGGFAVIDFASLGNAIMVPFAIAAFAIVWLASHAINMLILLSPFTTVDLALKGFRLAVLGLVAGTAFANPYVGAAVSLVLLIIACFIAGWSFRLLVFGSVYIWDFVTVRRKRFHPFRDGNRMFTARRIKDVPVRTYGWLSRREDSSLRFEYRPWLVMPRRQVDLPTGSYVVGRGLFFPQVARLDQDELKCMLILPPRYQTHEQELRDAYALSDVRDVGLRRCFKEFLEMIGLGKRNASATT